MIQRIYAHNFRCLENFELKLAQTPSALLIGQNGSGKSTIASIIEIFQSIGRGGNRIGELVARKDFAGGRSDIPMRFELEVCLDGQTYLYVLALELPEKFKELRVLEEQLSIAGTRIYSRQTAQVILNASPGDTEREARFLVDWHLVALPIIQEQSKADPLGVFKTWLSRLVVLAPTPSLMTGESNGESLLPKKDGSNIGEWLSGILSRYPASYTSIDRYLRSVMPDMQDILNEPTGRDSKSLVVRFKANDATLRVAFEDLSDGEKCFFVAAVVLAATEFHGSLFCFWDEPDSYLSLSQIANFVTTLRRSFQGKSQIFVTSHNPEAIRRFSDDNTYLLSRNNHLEPARCRPLSEIPIEGDLIDSMIRGDLEP